MAQRYNSKASPEQRKTMAKLFVADQRRREPATTTRTRIYGVADQMAHEQRGRAERDALKAQMAASKEAVRKKAAMKAAKKRSETGANSGTYGGARSLRNAFFNS